MRTRLTLRALAAACAGLLLAAAAAQPQPMLPVELPAASPPPPAGAAASAPVAERRELLLRALLQHSRSTLTLDGRQLAGAGLPRLRELLAASSVVMFGEDHGNAGIADFATALWHELVPLGFRHAAIEVDPWVGARMESELRRGGLAGWQRFLTAQGGQLAPFYAWDAEARYAAAVVGAGTAGQPGAARPPAPVLWGLDQVFFGAVPWLLAELGQQARTPLARQLARELRQDAAGSPDAWMRIPEARWHALRDALRHDRPRRKLVDAVLLSRRIYAPHMGGDGEALPANQLRETLMKRTLAAHLQRQRSARAADGPAAPFKLMLKFGAWHLYRGASPIQVQALGGFASAMATWQGGDSLNLLVLCAPGSELLQFDGSRQPCSAERYGGDWAFIEPYLDPAAYTLFDLRSWRFRPGRVGHLAPGVHKAMESFDLLVFPPRGPAAAYLEGVKPPVIPK